MHTTSSHSAQVAQQAPVTCLHYCKNNIEDSTGQYSKQHSTYTAQKTHLTCPHSRINSKERNSTAQQATQHIRLSHTMEQHTATQTDHSRTIHYIERTEHKDLPKNTATHSATAQHSTFHTSPNTWSPHRSLLPHLCPYSCFCSLPFRNVKWR